MLLENKKKSYNRQEWQRGYESQPQEYDYEIKDIEGEIPPTIEGTLFRNGPGLLDIHGTPIKHPFDGDGMVCAFSFHNGQVYFRNRYVETDEYVKEQIAGKMLYRGVFGTNKPGGWLNNIFDLRIKNIANTNVIYWGGKLLALWEAAEPYRLDPHNLATLGLDYLDGILQPGDSFAAHPWVDPNPGGEPRLVNFSVTPGLSSKITVYELDTKGKLLHRHSHIIPGFSFIHDFAITPNYCLFLQNAVSFNPLPFLLGLRGAGECVNFHADKPTRIIIIPRTPPYQPVETVEVEAGFVFHHANAFESGDNIYLDSICYQSLPQVQPDTDYKEVDFDALDPGELWRFTINTKDKTISKDLLESRCCEFPAIHPDLVGRSHRYVFIGAAHEATGNAPLQAILKIDLQTQERQLYSFAPYGYVSEPIFVPKSAGNQEDQGWILTLVYDGNKHRSDLVILDGENLHSGPVAKLHLKHHIPYGLHGSWTQESFF